MNNANLNYSETEEAKSKKIIDKLIKDAQIKRDKEGIASIAILLGNGISPYKLEQYKTRLALLYKGWRSNQSETEKKIDELTKKCWNTFEKLRIGSWNRAPRYHQFLSTVFLWMLSGLVRVVFTSNYDLCLESMLDKSPENGYPIRRMKYKLNPVLAANIVSESDPVSLYTTEILNPLYLDAPISIVKYNGTCSHITLRGTDWGIHGRLLEKIVKHETIRNYQGEIIKYKKFTKELKEVICFTPLHEFDLRFTRHNIISHHVDWVLPGVYFYRERDGALRIFDRIAKDLSGFIIFGNIGQPGEVLNRVLLKFADDKPVIQILPLNPERFESKRYVTQSLWANLPSRKKGFRLVIFDNDYDPKDESIENVQSFVVEQEKVLREINNSSDKFSFEEVSSALLDYNVWAPFVRLQNMEDKEKK